MTAEGEAVGSGRREPEDKHDIVKELYSNLKKEPGTIMATGNLFHCLHTIPHIMGHMFSTGKQSLVRVLFLISKTIF